MDPGAPPGYADAMDRLALVLKAASNLAWGLPLLVLLVGGGLLLTLYSRLVPFSHLRHAVELLLGRHDDGDAPGEISHFQALSTALASTIGMGNIGGVAIAITQGGPGAVFWMWVAALVGMATKFFTCTLAVLYRGRDSAGQLQGGPMYTIEVGLGRRWRPLAVLFAVFGMIGCLALFQANQMAEVLEAEVGAPRWVTGVAAILVVGPVVLGGLKRIAAVAARLVPAMCLLYVACAVLVVLRNAEAVPGIFERIFHDAFTGTAATGAAAGIAFRTVIQTGIKRAAFSNEAGLGTAAMAHGAARTREPVREGLVAMLGPFIDTIVVCTLTALVVLSAGQWQTPGVQGASLTTAAFEAAAGLPGKVAMLLVVTLFGVSTMFGYSYYGRKCCAYLFGVERARWYDYVYLGSLLVGAVFSVDMVVNTIDTAFALMAFPNMLATLLLAPKVMAEARRYFGARRSVSGSGAPG